MASASWVRGRTRPSARRASAQLGQAQFHCGRPPPAADPRTRILMSSPAAVATFVEGALFGPRRAFVAAVEVVLVTANLRVHPQLGECGSLVLHGTSCS